MYEQEKDTLNGGKPELKLLPVADGLDAKRSMHGVNENMQLCVVILHAPDSKYVMHGLNENMKIVRCSCVKTEQALRMIAWIRFGTDRGNNDLRSTGT